MKLAVLLSGGVDSSVALRLLAEEGRGEITAYYIKVWLEDEVAELGRCPWEEDLEYARAVAEAARVPLEIVALQREYHERVVSYTLAELRAGRTPSPDIFCNQRIKFGAFLEAAGNRAEGVASGHYARVRDLAGSRQLLKGVDPVKDQTYFLSFLEQRQLARCVFPVGVLRKEEVRRLAAQWGLATRDRPDSQGICFLGKIRFDEFVRARLGERTGEIRDAATGKVLGEHPGFWFYTIGQRRGLKLSGGPWFVVRKDVEQNVVHVAHLDALQQYSRRVLRVAAPHWIGAPPSHGSLDVKLRHGERVYRARLTLDARGGEVELESADAGVAPGQFVVFYEGDVCLGGAMIAA